MSHKLQQKLLEFFKIPQKAFAYVGIDPLTEDTKIIIKRPFICYGLYTLTFIFTLASIDYCIKNIHNVNDITEAISLLNQLVICLLKMAIFIGKRRRIHKLIKDIWQWNETADSDEFQIISKINSKNVLLSKFYCRTVFSAGLFGILMPAIQKLYSLLQGQEGVLKLPHKISFLWDISTPVGLSAAYLWDILTIHFLINCSIAIDTFFMWSVSNILVRFCILKMHLKMAAEQNHHAKFCNIIKDTVKAHLHILYLVQELDSIFGEIIFVKSLMSCTQICFLAFYFLENNNSALDLLHPFLFLVAVCMQLILYCYNGHLIEEQSLLVSKHIFETFDWSRLPNSHQKMLQMIMLRSQKSSHITGILFNLNLSLYLWFFKTAASLITMIRTIQDKS